MNTFPLIRKKWSNEHIMAALFIVLILYHLPIWVKTPVAIFQFIVLVASGLLFDAVANLILYKRMWCCVSGGVTAAIISLLGSGVPLWIQLLGVAAALILGKYLWGGTGKNILNPAMVGVLVVMLVGHISFPFFQNSYLLFPAILLGLPFLLIRPYTGIGFIAGSFVMLILGHDLNTANVLSSGILFWGCVVLTDPVTVTNHRLYAPILGVLSGVAIIANRNQPYYFIAIILLVNTLSYLLDSLVKGKVTPTFSGRLRIPKVFLSEEDNFLDLVGEDSITMETDKLEEEFSAEDLIQCVKKQGVYGMGGAAYPTDQKLVILHSSKEDEKYLIINAVECDPGLIHDSYILRKYPQEIIKGVEALQKCFGFHTVYLTAKNTEKLHFTDNIKLHTVRDYYPLGAERILIQEVLDKKLSKDQIPVQKGILVLNVQTIYAIYKAVYCNAPANTRLITVANRRNQSAKVVRVRLGMKVFEVLEAVYPGKTQCFVGGGIMQAHLAQEDEVIDRTVNFIATGPFPKYKESPQCSHCGKCIQNCPAGLQVNQIVSLVEQGKLQDTIPYGAKECIGCASCSYSCMAGRNLCAKVNTAKQYKYQE
jgi:Predicted NADH:ubiquinone oxidoreductase, subunit RnfC